MKDLLFFSFRIQAVVTDVIRVQKTERKQNVCPPSYRSKKVRENKDSVKDVKWKILG